MPQLAPAPPTLPAPSLDPFRPATAVTPPASRPPTPPPVPKSLLDGAPKHKGGRRWPLVIGLVLVVVGLGGGALAFYVWQRQLAAVAPTPTPTPEEILREVWGNWKAVKTLHADYELSLKVEAPAGTALADELQRMGVGSGTMLSMTVAADAAPGEQPPKGSGTMNLSIPIGGTPTGGLLRFTPTIAFVAPGNQVVYLRLDNVALLLSQFGLDEIAGQWIKIDFNTLGQSGLPGVNQQQLDEQRAQSQQLMQELQRMYQEHPFLSVMRGATLPDTAEEELQLEIDQPQLEQFLSAAIEYLNREQGLTLGAAGSTAAEREKVMAALRSLQLSGTVRYGTADRMVHRLNLTAVVTPTEAGVAQGTITTTASAQFSKLNEPITVTEPTQFITFEELMGKVMAEMSKQLLENQPGAPAAATPDGIQVIPGAESQDSDGDGLPDAAEEYLGTNPQQADSDGDGFDDGTEVKNGFNPLGPGKMESSVE